MLGDGRCWFTGNYKLLGEELWEAGRGFVECLSVCVFFIVRGICKDESLWVL